MFRKDFHVRSNTAIKGSDRRKLRANVSQQFIDFPTDEAIPSKDNLTVMKISTHADQTVLVYCLHGDPIFLECRDKPLCPTVYTLWKYPHMLPSLVTWPAVLDKLVAGADLMLPGVIIPSGGLSPMAAGQLCAVCLACSAAPVAVGLTTMSTADMIASGMKGKGVRILHCYKDHLWIQGIMSHPPKIEFQSIQKTALPRNNSPSPPSSNSANNTLDDKQLQQMTLVNSTSDRQSVSATETDDNTVELPVDGATAAAAGQDTDSCVDVNGAMDSNRLAENEELEDDTSPAEKMDRLLYQCLLHSLKSKVKKSDLPLLTSSLYRNHMLPCCPKNQTLDIKKSSYKKLSKFLQAMHAEQLLSVKATGKGVDSIVEIDKSHPDLRAFQIPDDDVSSDLQDVSKEGAASSDETAWTPPEIRELYQVTSKMLPVLLSTGCRKGTWLTSEEVCKAVTNYIKENDLPDKTDRRLVILDPILHDAVISKKEDSRTHLKWDELYARCFRELTGGHHLVLGNNQSGSTDGQSIKKGNIQPIVIKIQKKAGNKLVTLTTGLETFGIDPKDFSHRVQKGVSASSSCAALEGQKSKCQQVLVQGNQIHYIEKLLTELYKIPRKYIQGLELAPKSGKRR